MFKVPEKNSFIACRQKESCSHEVKKQFYEFKLLLSFI